TAGRVADDVEPLLRLAAVDEAHEVALAVSVDLDLEEARERVDDGDTYAVEAARDLVAVAAELAAGVQHSEHDLGRAEVVVLGVELDGDAAAVVDDLAPAVFEEGDVDAGAVARHRLVDRVVDDLVDQVVQTARPRGADVHARPFAHRLEALEHGDVLRAVGLGARHLRIVHGIAAFRVADVLRSTPRKGGARHDKSGKSAGQEPESRPGDSTSDGTCQRPPKRRDRPRPRTFAGPVRTSIERITSSPTTSRIRSSRSRSSHRSWFAQAAS